MRFRLRLSSLAVCLLLLSSCQSTLRTGAVAHEAPHLVPSTTVSFIADHGKYRLTHADIVVVNTMRTDLMTVVTLKVVSPEKVAALNAFFKKHHGRRVRVMFGQNTMHVQMMIHQPLVDGTMNIHVKNSDHYALRFLDQVILNQMKPSS